MSRAVITRFPDLGIDIFSKGFDVNDKQLLVYQHLTECINQITAAEKSISDALALANAALQNATASAQHAYQTLEGMEVNTTVRTVYRQGDEDWSSVKMGTSQSTIGQFGCLITSMASILTDASRVDVYTPLTLNDWLTRNGGYTNGAQFVFGVTDKLGYLKFDKLIDCLNIPAPMAELNAAIAAGDFVLVKVNNGLPPDYHWCRYIGNDEVIDPWYGDISKIVPRYKGKDSAQSILRAVIYKRVATA